MNGLCSQYVQKIKDPNKIHIIFIIFAIAIIISLVNLFCSNLFALTISDLEVDNEKQSPPVPSLKTGECVQDDLMGTLFPL
jgi:hypothetical protein